MKRILIHLFPSTFNQTLLLSINALRSRLGGKIEVNTGKFLTTGFSVHFFSPPTHPQIYTLTSKNTPIFLQYCQSLQLNITNSSLLVFSIKEFSKILFSLPKASLLIKNNSTNGRSSVN